MNYRVFYIIENLLRLKCLKWARMTHLDIWNTSYSQKKGQESNWQFDSRSLKVMNHPDFLTCRWRATYCWKALDEGYNFASNLISIGGLHAKLWGHKVVTVSVVRISRLPPGSPGTICHLDVGLGQYAIWMWAWDNMPFGRGTKYTIRGKVVASPKSGLWWALWIWVARGLS
jgi:hypothetical protein